MEGLELKNRRRKLYLTQVDLSEEFGVSSNTVARWENGVLEIPKMVELAMRAVERYFSNLRDLKVQSKENAVKLSDFLVDNKLADNKHHAEELIKYNQVILNNSPTDKRTLIYLIKGSVNLVEVEVLRYIVLADIIE